ncbi:glycosyl hydrolase [Aspergillus floccosus]
MKGSSILAAALALSSSALALPKLWDNSLHKKADSTKVGYLGVYWTTENESVYFALSDNSNPTAFKSINGGEPVVSPTLGTKAIRDASIIEGVGDNAGKYYIIGTDLDIDTTNWGQAVRTGSRGIFVWESTDLVTWTNERLVTVEDETAGMVWAPDAVWDPSKGQYFVHWASQFYAEDDTDHTGDPTTTTILRYAYTSDFKTFSEPETYIDLKTATTIDLAFLTVDENTFVRFYVHGNTTSPVVEVSKNGLFGDWAAPSGGVEDSASFEGPYPFWDNAEEGKAYLLCDRVGSNPGLAAWESTDPVSGAFTPVSSMDITFMRHGSVIPVTQEQYDALAAL